MSGSDSAAFDAAFARCAAGVRRRLERIVRDASAAEDLLQETFLKLWRRTEPWPEGDGLERWLGAVATNLALNHLRTQRRRPSQPLPEAILDDAEQGEGAPGWLMDAASLTPDRLCEQAEERQLLWTWIETLPEAQREVLTLAAQDQMDTAGIAAALGVAPGTVKSRLHYARERLKAFSPDLEG